MSREILLANAENRMTNFWIMLSFMTALTVMVMIPAFVSAYRMDRLRKERKGRGRRIGGR